VKIAIGAGFSTIRNMKVNGGHCANFNEMMGIFAVNVIFVTAIIPSCVPVVYSTRKGYGIGCW
jgi:hypothetical protein